MNKDKGYHFYTNGETTIRLKPSDDIPDGFYRGRTFKSNPWNKGLTSQDNTKIKEYSEKSSNTRKLMKLEPWNKGLTKETDKRVHGNSGEKNGMFGKHRLAWNKGLTKEDDEKVRQMSENHKGVKAWNKGMTYEECHNVSKKDMVLNIYKTKKENKTFNVSKSEEIYYKTLIEEYGNENVKRQYYDAERYPYNCDFYIPSEDLFIELNLCWTHGGKPYNPTDIECQKQLNEWKEKAKNSEYYKNAIYTWTDLDVRKQNCAKENNLNYKNIYQL